MEFCCRRACSNVWAKSLATLATSAFLASASFLRRRRNTAALRFSAGDEESGNERGGLSRVDTVGPGVRGGRDGGCVGRWGRRTGAPVGRGGWREAASMPAFNSGGGGERLGGGGRVSKSSVGEMSSGEAGRYGRATGLKEEVGCHGEQEVTSMPACSSGEGGGRLGGGGRMSETAVGRMSSGEARRNGRATRLQTEIGCHSAVHPAGAGGRA